MFLIAKVSCVIKAPSPFSASMVKPEILTGRF